MKSQNNNRFSHSVSVFQERIAPEKGNLAGYAALYFAYELTIPIPDKLALISEKHKRYNTAQWQIFTPRYRPENNLAAHLIFALKYEGIELLLLKKLFETIAVQEWETIVAEEPLSQYRRKIWFLYEWLTQTKLDVPDLSTGNYVDLVDTKLQYGLTNLSEPSKRHRIHNNLPGTKDFCPMIRKTALLENYIKEDLSQKTADIIGAIHPDIMNRAAAFLLLKDSKASYTIEGESVPQNRVQRWGRAIGQAGQKPITKEELLRLQQIVIDNPRFVSMGFRTEEGFVGEHDRFYGTPIPAHISARSKNINQLMEGWIATEHKLEKDKGMDAVLAAAMLAFGFVFIHPFADGNGRIHRYLIHHILSRKEFVSKKLIFPISAIILEEIEAYRKVLESFSIPRLEYIEWKPDDKNNIEVLNETIDFYRYFDATAQAEFLYKCVRQTIEKTIPEEVDYLEKYDLMKNYLDTVFQMPDKIVSLLIWFLEKGKGKLSQRAKNKEFSMLSIDEIQELEKQYQYIFKHEK